MARHTDLELPQEALREGTRLALSRGALLISHALIAAEANCVLGAAVLFSQGIEELGKAVMLKEVSDHQSGATRLVRGFFDHEAKLAKASGILPPGSLMVYEASFDADEYWDAERCFGGKSVDDWTTRLDWLYVGWIERERRWRDLPRLDLDLLRRNIRSVADFIATKQLE